MKKGVCVWGVKYEHMKGTQNIVLEVDVMKVVVGKRSKKRKSIDF